MQEMMQLGCSAAIVGREYVPPSKHCAERPYLHMQVRKRDIDTAVPRASRARLKPS